MTSKDDQLIEDFLNCVSCKTFGRSRTEEACVKCGSNKVKPEDFCNDISRREYKLSHFCQKCQDEFFGEDK